jgi:cyclic pyranopterin phosphate synthase
MASLYPIPPSTIVYPPEDLFGRPMGSLRVSVTDRCNLRCQYCMPEKDYLWLARENLLTFEEITRLIGIFTAFGVRDVHLTGGEPLLRRDLPRLVGMLAANPLIEDLALTTNGIFLAEQAQLLRDAGLHRITVSLDTLRPQTFRDLTGRDVHARVLEGIEAIREARFANVKLDTVVVKGVNDDELGDIVEFSRQRGIEARFIEYMDVGGATHWSMNQVISRAEIIEILSRRYGRIEPVIPIGRAPAERFLLPGGTVFGIVASTTTPFCQQCDRSRLTADGMWLLCLYALIGLDLRRLVRGGASLGEVQSEIVYAWQRREYRGAEERTALRLRAALVGIEQLRGDPHLEMHTRGG